MEVVNVFFSSMKKSLPILKRKLLDEGEITSLELSKNQEKLNALVWRSNLVVKTELF